MDSQKWLDFAAASRPPKKWLYKLEAARVRKLEKRLAGQARAVSVVSRAEADVYDAFTQVGAATVATNGVDLDYFAPVGCEEQPALAFVGALDYLPNEDAAVWFTREMWPAIHAKYPAVEFRIIGRNPTPAVQTLASVPGAKLVGQVPDVRPFVASAAVVVVPLRLARGVQNKVLEAMAMAKAGDRRSAGARGAGHRAGHAPAVGFGAARMGRFACADCSPTPRRWQQFGNCGPAIC